MYLMGLGIITLGPQVLDSISVEMGGSKPQEDHKSVCSSRYLTHSWVYTDVI